MQTFYQCSLKPFNTLSVEAAASELVVVNSESELTELIRLRGHEIELVLGGGSNIVITKDIDGLVVVNKSHSICSKALGETKVMVSASAGVNWDQLVRHCAANGLWGIENLAAIPGSVGAGPIQNIGAYGVELDSVLYSLEVIDRNSGQLSTIAAKDCGFEYRNSHFKNQWKDKYIITSVSLMLSKLPNPQLGYGELRSAFSSGSLEELSVQDIYDCVAKIRSNKLPDPKAIPNVGSFFKNPVITNMQFRELQIKHPGIAHYPLDDGTVKIAAGWLLDQAGWKNRTSGGVAVHHKQALVVINTGAASGHEVVKFASSIQQDISSKYGIHLEIEPTIV